MNKERESMQSTDILAVSDLTRGLSYSLYNFIVDFFLLCHFPDVHVGGVVVH